MDGGRRIVVDEVAGEAGGHVPGRGRVAGHELQSLDPVILATTAEGVAEESLSTRTS